MKEKIYYDRDADLKFLKGKTVGIIGYGIQGRAQALNMRDSGINVMVANKADSYLRQLIRDGFKNNGMRALVKNADIIMLLIPDQAQPLVYKRYIEPLIRPECMLIFAHGYALRYQTIRPRLDIDVAMLAPRMPGHHIRNYYLGGSGVPAFIDIVKNCSGLAKKRLLAIAKGAGFTRAGVLEVNYKVEADLDLFTEQFLVAALVKVIHTGFNLLTDTFGYPPVPVLMELYASGELAEVLKLAAKAGISDVFRKNASPTCQFGIAYEFDRVFGNTLEKTAVRIITQIQDASFSKMLEKEGLNGYPMVKALWKRVKSKKLSAAQKWINNSFKTKRQL